jgi:DNA-binding CsgD family transcriptional regulator
MRPILGRAGELDQVFAFLNDGTPAERALVLSGEAGIGKTTIWRAGVRHAEARGLRALVAQPAESESGLPYAALGDLLEPVPDEAFHRLPPQQHAAVAAAVARAKPTGPIDPHALARAVVDLLSEGPLLVAIDDAQWLDAPTAAVLDFALRRLRREPVGALVAGRTAGGLELEPALAVERLRVGPLNEAAIHRIVRAQLDVALPRPELLRVHDASGGNPFYALELARALGGPGGAHEALRARVAALDDGMRELLLVVALLPDPTVARLRAVVADRVGVGNADARLEAAVDAELIERHGDRIRFAHALLASAVSEHEGAVRRRDVHRRLAEVEDDSEARARHLALATEGYDAEVAAALDHAAQDALARGAPSAAAELLELAIERTPPGPEVDLTGGKLALAEAHFSSGAIGRAKAVLRELLDELPPGDERADVLVRLANGSPDLEAALELAERALLEVEEDDVVRSRVHLLLGQAWPLRGLVAALEDGRLALDHAERSGDRRLVVDVLARLTVWELWAGRDPSDLLARAVELEEPQDALLSYRSPRMPLALLRMYQGRLDEARGLFDTLFAEAVAFGDEIAALGVRGRLVDVALRAGDWADAAAQADEAYELAEQIGLEHDGGLTVYWKALVAAHLGRVDEARSLAEHGVSIAAAAKQENTRVMNVGVLGFLELSLGDDAAALPHLEPLLEWVDSRGLGLATHPTAPYAVEALVGAGRVDEASRLVERLEGEARTIDSRWGVAVAARSRALLDSIPEPLEEPDERWPFERARTLLVLGRLQRRAKQKNAAKQALELARSIFDTLPAPLWSERAAEELARIGLRRSSPDGLTESERRVAELAASGLTNREVAAQLFMSPKTVEANISRVYRKLGINSRAQLGARLAQM